MLNIYIYILLALDFISVFFLVTGSILIFVKHSVQRTFFLNFFKQLRTEFTLGSQKLLTSAYVSFAANEIVRIICTFLQIGVRNSID